MHPIPKTIASLILVSMAVSIHAMYFDWPSDGPRLDFRYWDREVEGVLLGLVLPGCFLLGTAFLWAIRGKPKSSST